MDDPGRGQDTLDERAHTAPLEEPAWTGCTALCHRRGQPRGHIPHTFGRDTRILLPHVFS